MPVSMRINKQPENKLTEGQLCLGKSITRLA